MKRIHKLPLSIISQIAAGEVVERPASVVKELIENSIDAQAKHISLSIFQGGIDLIQLEDDGYGVDEEDVEAMFEHHATSKIKQIEDLFTLKSFGFRGEALSSIASVSKVTLWSKTANSTGFEAVLKSGKIVSMKSRPRSSAGTTIKVEGLFQEIPARKKFLKSVKTETHHVYRVFEDFAVAYPNISFQMTSNGVLHKSLTPTKPLIRVSQIWPPLAVESLIPIEFNGKDLQVLGFISHPHTSFSRLKYSKLYVQNRPVTSSLIHKAIIDGYDTMLEVRKFPSYILKVSLKSDCVDVNVHPRKLEVKFDDERLIYKTIRSTISQSLQKQYVESMTTTTPVTTQNFQTFKSDLESTTSNDSIRTNNFSARQTSVPTKVYPTSPNLSKEQKQLQHLVKEEKVQANQLSALPYSSIYQLLKMYIVVLYEDKVEVIDQHAAHEKILLEKLLNAHQLHVQKLISPITIEVQNEQKTLLFEHIKDIQGFEVRDFGSHTIIIETVPTFLQEKNKSFFQELIDTIISDQDSLYPQQFTSTFYKTVACKAAVKAGDVLHIDEMKKLIEDLHVFQKAYTCCHGRPTIKTFGQKELDILFSR